MSLASHRTSAGTVVDGPVLDAEAVRRDFPALAQQVHDKPLAYLDNAASAQKPRRVTETIKEFYEHDYANIHRGVHLLSQRATERYEAVRKRVRDFIGADSVREVIFVRGTTEAINLVAATYGREHVGQGDEVLITGMEHHSNIVPWQMLCAQTGAELKVVPIQDNGQVRFEDYEAMVSERTKIAAITHVSNALGTINPVKRMTEAAHAKGAVVLVDGAQAVPHMKVNVQEIGCDFYAFSAHKVYGPSGVGVLWGKASLLEAMPPYQGGGDMIASVTFEKTTYNDLPYKFEAGTPNIAGVVGMGAAIEYVQSLGLDRIAAWELELLTEATTAVAAIDKVRLIGTAPCKAGVLSFVIDGIHPHDIGTILDHEGVAIRTGHHCAQPVMDRLGVPATARASFACYNTRQDVERLVSGIHKAIEVFG